MKDDKDFSPENFGFITFGLYYDVIERVRTLDKNIIHTYNLAKYLYENYDTYYRISEMNNKVREKNLYEPYVNVLKLMIYDIKELKKILKKIKESMLDCYNVKYRENINNKTKKEVIKLTKEYLKLIRYRGFPKNIGEDNKEKYNAIYEKWVNKKIDEYFWDKSTPSSSNEFLLDVRDLIRYDNSLPINISIGSMLKSFSYITHSLYQSLGGMYIGNIIEHEPSVYPHKDMCHVMRFGSLYYCNGYQEFWKKLLKVSIDNIEKFINNEKIFDENNIKETIGELFYNVSGIDITSNDNENKKTELKLDYTIVFGDSQLPQVIDRYKLIRLPLTCAYRPRYWSALAHEVSHSFITSLLIFEKVLNEVSIFNDREGKLASTILKYARKRELKEKINYIGYIYDIIEYVFKRLTQDSYYLRASKTKLKNDDMSIFKFKNAYVGEIVADVFGFLFSGYAYIPSLIANTALGRLPKVDSLYLVRMGVIIGIGEGFYYDFIKERKILNKEELRNKNSRSPKHKVINEFIGLLYSNEDNKKHYDSDNEIFMFLKSFEHILTHDLIPSYGFKESHYYYALGKDLGTDLHKRILKELIKQILYDNEIPNFGWFKYTPNNDDKKFELYVLLNMLLNNTCIKRINNVFKTSEEKAFKDIIKLCESVETMKLFKQMKELKWMYSQDLSRCQ